MYLDNDQFKFMKAMKDAVEEKGENYVYEQASDLDSDSDYLSCHYVRDGKPSCIVGHAAINSGLVETETLMMSEGTNAGLVLPFDTGDVVSRAAVMAQNAQDNEHTWGYAYGMALGFLTGLGYDVDGLTL